MNVEQDEKSQRFYIDLSDGLWLLLKPPENKVSGPEDIFTTNGHSD